MIKHWSFKEPGRRDDKLYRYTNFVGDTLPPPPYVKDPLSRVRWQRAVDRLPRVHQRDGGDWVYDWEVKAAPPDVTYKAALPAQNNNDPPGVFPNHCMVGIGDKYYDPSYGVIYKDLLEFQNKAVDGFYVVRDIKVNPNDTNDVRAMLIMKAPRGLGVYEPTP